jgi:hypothetical protein
VISNNDDELRTHYTTGRIMDKNDLKIMKISKD